MVLTDSRFMSGRYDDVRLPFSVMDPVVGDVLSVFWEPEMMQEMGSALKILTSEILTQVGQQVLQATVMTALMSALQWPISEFSLSATTHRTALLTSVLTKLGYLIDNPWSNALDRARAAGLVLADTIIQRHAGVRPVSLIGFSLGARAIFYALIELARCKAFGLVQDVFLFGTTMTASRQTWLDVRSVVGGRFVNGYATNDWILGYLFRATTGGLNTVAGLRAVENVPGLENVDVTELITGHMSYRSSMPLLLAHVGFPVTSEHFDEPEDPDVDMSIQERRIVDEAEEEAKKNNKKILGIFPRRGSTKPKPTGTTPVESRPPEVEKQMAGEYELDDDDDLPPRQDDDGDLGAVALGTSKEPKVLDDEEAKMAEAIKKAEKEEATAMSSISKTAGFDFAAISKELGKDIDVEALKEPAPPSLVQRISQPPPLERSGSAPPEIKVFTDLPDSTASNDPIIRSASFVDAPSPIRRDSGTTASDDDEDDDGDMARQTNKMSLGDNPSWDRPASTSISPPLSAGIKAPSWGFNAWASSSSPSSPSSRSGSPLPSSIGPPSGLPMRAAPPARPHPAEFMANPFAGPLSSSSSTSLSSPSQSTSAIALETGTSAQKPGWSKDEELATNNPW